MADTRANNLHIIAISEHLKNHKVAATDATSTIMDWQRDEVRLNSQLVSRQDLMEVDPIEKVLDKNLPHAHKDVKSYINHHAHQNGFLNQSQTLTVLPLALQYKYLTGERRNDFIDNNDGSITYIQEFSISAYRDENYEDPHDSNNNGISTEHTPTNGKPIALGVTVSIIKPDATNPRKVTHELVSDTIFLMDEQHSKVLFPESNGVVAYDKTHEQFLTEYNAYIQNLIESKKIVAKPSIDEVSAAHTVSETSSASSDIAIENDSVPIRREINSSFVFDLPNKLAQQDYSELLLEKHTSSYLSANSSLTKPKPSAEVSVPAADVEMERARPLNEAPTRLSDGQVILRTTAAFAVAGGVTGAGIGTVIALGFLFPSLGLSLLAIPICASLGFAVGGFIGLMGSAIGCGLDRIARMPEVKPIEPQTVAEPEVRGISPNVSARNFPPRNSFNPAPSLQAKSQTSYQSQPREPVNVSGSRDALSNGAASGKSKISIPPDDIQAPKNKP